MTDDAICSNPTSMLPCAVTATPSSTISASLRHPEARRWWPKRAISEQQPLLIGSDAGEAVLLGAAVAVREALTECNR
ncbi:hypothetical protein DEJ19_021010 (plasmid) [Curtobacterium sp. MCSS17_016]|nr:hypothetical protein DEJ19_021010 [Curtobacterium sp. MCSS17_016]